MTRAGEVARRRLVAGALLALLVWLAPAERAAAEPREEPSPWHLALDATVGRTRTGFVGLATLVPDSPGVDVAPPPRHQERDVVRLLAALGLAELALEVGATLSLGQRPYVAWSAGVRIETSWRAPLAVAFRFAFVERAGDAPGRGGRAGIALAIRPFLPVSLYAEATADVTNAPAQLRDEGTLVAYALSATGGIRLSFR